MKNVISPVGLVVVCATALVSNSVQAITHDSIVHGTINVVIADRNGTVILTDSMQTLQSGEFEKQLRRPGQKLFQLDDQTVCALAGFLASPNKLAPEFLNKTGQMIQEYKREAAGWGRPLTFDEKFGVLKSVFQFFVSGVITIKGDIAAAQQYSLELFLVGYDVDGSQKLASALLQVRSRERAIGIKESSTLTLGNNFVYRLHGAADIAEQMMTMPENFAKYSAIARYADAKRKGSLAGFNVADMKQLAIALADRTSRAYKTVGGANQIAVLANGKVVSIEQPQFARLPPQRFGFNIAAFQHEEGALIGLTPGAVNVHVHNTYSYCAEIILDTNFFVDNEFIRCPIVYDGKMTRFETDNRVVDSILIIGPNATERSQINALSHNFRWRAICHAASRHSQKLNCVDSFGHNSELDWKWPWPQS